MLMLFGVTNASGGAQGATEPGYGKINGTNAMRAFQPCIWTALILRCIVAPVFVVKFKVVDNGGNKGKLDYGTT